MSKRTGNRVAKKLAALAKARPWDERPIVLFEAGEIWSNADPKELPSGGVGVRIVGLGVGRKKPRPL